MTAAPPASAWDRALDGIGQQGREIKAIGEQLRTIQAQIADLGSSITKVRDQVFEGDSTVLSMTDARIATHQAKVDAQLASHDARLLTLESGATAAILRRLDDGRAADMTWREEERKDRAAGRAATARRELLLLVLLAGILLAVLALVGVLIWLGVH